MSEGRLVYSVLDFLRSSVKDCIWSWQKQSSSSSSRLVICFKVLFRGEGDRKSVLSYLAMPSAS